LFLDLFLGWSKRLCTSCTSCSQGKWTGELCDVLLCLHARLLSGKWSERYATN
jgi:hypothetical protein